MSFTNYFETVIDSSEVGIRKPDPKIFQIAVDRLGVLPEEVIVIGDSYSRDIVPSKTIGCSTIWLDGKSWTRPSETSKADFVIHSIEEVSDTVLET